MFYKSKSWHLPLLIMRISPAMAMRVAAWAAAAMVAATALATAATADMAAAEIATPAIVEATSAMEQWCQLGRQGECDQR